MPTSPAPSAEEQPGRRAGRVMIALAWLAVLGLLWLFFADFLERKNNPNRNLAIQAGASELVLKRNRAGHYVVPGTINGQPVNFLLDTGATQVSVPASMGERLGLKPGMQVMAVTANGTATAYTTLIDAISFGPFTLYKVQASLNPGMTTLDEVLLGMNVLKQLEFTQRGDTLILRPHSPPSAPQ